MAAEYRAHRAVQQTRVHRTQTTAQAHHRRAAAVVRHRHHRIIAVVQARQAVAAQVLRYHHRAQPLHRAAVQALRDHLVHSVAVAHQVAAAVDSILQGVCPRCGILLVVILTKTLY